MNLFKQFFFKSKQFRMVYCTQPNDAFEVKYIEIRQVEENFVGKIREKVEIPEKKKNE